MCALHAGRATRWPKTGEENVFLMYLPLGCLASNGSPWAYASYLAALSWGDLERGLDWRKGHRILACIAATKILSIPPPNWPDPEMVQPASHTVPPMILPRTIHTANLPYPAGHPRAILMYVGPLAACTSSTKVPDGNMADTLLVWGLEWWICRSASVSPGLLFFFCFPLYYLSKNKWG